jgi:hypothetical protein
MQLNRAIRPAPLTLALDLPVNVPDAPLGDPLTIQGTGMAAPRFIRWFRERGLADVALVGEKNASLGEMYCERNGRGSVIPKGLFLNHAQKGTSIPQHFLDNRRILWLNYR